MAPRRGYTDLMTRIRNGYATNRETVPFVYTTRNIDLLMILKDEGFISGWTETIPEDPKMNLSQLKIQDLQEGQILLKYINGQPALTHIEAISTESRRIQMKLPELESFLIKEGYNKLIILSTNKGLMTHTKALSFIIGGEAVCLVK
jgi:small subunit ribosomal protein S8